MRRLRPGRGGHRGARSRAIITAAAGGRAPQGNNGLGLLTWAGGLVGQPALVKTSKFGWKQAWRAMVQELAPQDGSGGYVRPRYAFVADEWRREAPPGRDPAASRFVLYVGNACPWCHRTKLAAALLGSANLEVVEMTDDAERASRGGWVFDAPDPLHGCRDLRELYEVLSGGSYTGRCTAPLLVSRGDAPGDHRAVSNESPDIVRFLDGLGGKHGITLFPAALEAELAATCDDIYANINNGVYRCGFATRQEAYDRAVDSVYEALARYEERLAETAFVAGDKITVADVYLLPTLLRFDACYSTLFRVCGPRLVEFPNLHAYMRRCHALPGVAATFDLQAARESYYGQLFPLTPSLLVPTRPTLAEVLRGPPAGEADGPLVVHVRDVAYAAEA